jgi:hypothetical protein
MYVGHFKGSVNQLTSYSRPNALGHLCLSYIFLNYETNMVLTLTAGSSPGEVRFWGIQTEDWRQKFKVQIQVH